MRRRAAILAVAALAVVAVVAAPAPAKVTSIGIYHHTQGPRQVVTPGDVIFVQAAPFLPRPVCRRKVRWSLKDGAGKVHQMRRIRPKYTQDWLTGRIYASVGTVARDAAPGMGRLRAKQRCPDVAKTSGSLKMRIVDPDAPPARITNVSAPDMIAGEGGKIRFSLNVLSRVEATLEYEIVPGRWLEVGTFLKRKYYKEGGAKTLEWGGKVRGKLPPAGRYRVMVRPRALSIADDYAGPPTYGEFFLAREITGFGNPIDAQTGPDGRVVVVDGDTKRLVALGPDDAIARIFGEGLTDPLDVAFGPDGSAFVADGSSGNVVRIGPDGAQSTLPTGRTSFGRGGPQGIAASASELFVADGDQVEVLGLDGTPARQIDDDRFQTPRSVAVAPGGTVWIADPGAEMLFQFHPAGNPLTSLSRLSPRVTIRPRGVDVTSSGRVLFTDSNSAVVQDVTGAVAFGAGLLGQPGGIGYADGLAAAGRAGDVYVVDRNADRVLHFRVP